MTCLLQFAYSPEKTKSYPHIIRIERALSFSDSLLGTSFCPSSRDWMGAKVICFDTKSVHKFHGDQTWTDLDLHGALRILHMFQGCIDIQGHHQPRCKPQRVVWLACRLNDGGWGFVDLWARRKCNDSKGGSYLGNKKGPVPFCLLI